MAEWRLLRGWSSEALRQRMDALAGRPRNFEAVEAEMTGERGWHHYHSDALISSGADADGRFAFGREPRGPRAP